MTLFDYPVTRPIAFSRWQLVLVIVSGIFLSILVTIFNIAATGYEPFPVTSTSFTNDAKLWYERVVPPGWFSQSWSCNPATLNLNDGSVDIDDFDSSIVDP
jgi:hypothetical protein